jgi:fumarate reductase flavoprotein subunit
MHNDDVWPYPELDALALAGVLVDRSGRRFHDEGLGGVALANAVARHADPLSATAIFDAAIWEGPGRSARIPANPALENAGGTILRAGSLDEIARLAGIDAAALTETVARHNSAIAEGSLGRLNPPRTTSRHAALPLATAPFMAIPVCAGITYTMGGIRVDGRSRVRRAGGGLIDGLYAAGSTTGGLEGGENAAYVGGLVRAGVQSLIAAEEIAKCATDRIARDTRE